jgi:hypothetical protein
MKRVADLASAIVGLALICCATGQARGDFVLSSPSVSGFAETSGQSANSGGYFNSYQPVGSPSVSESYNNSFGSNGTSGSSLSNSLTLGARSFTDSVSGSSHASAASDGTGTNPYTYSNGYVQWRTQITIDRPSVGTVSWNPTSLTFGSFNAPNSGSQDSGGLTQLSGNGVTIYVEGYNSESISSNSPTYLFTGMRSYNSVSSGTANSVSIALSPGTYNLYSEVFSAAFISGSAGYVDPNTAGNGSITINALSTPEPSSLFLFCVGAVGIIGALSRSGRKRATANSY